MPRDIQASTRPPPHIMPQAEAHTRRHHPWLQLVCTLGAGSRRRRWHWNRLKQQPRLIVRAWRGVVLVRLEGEVGPRVRAPSSMSNSAMNVERVDLDTADLARPVGHALHKLATAPAKVLEAQEDGLANEGVTGRMEADQARLPMAPLSPPGSPTG